MIKKLFLSILFSLLVVVCFAAKYYVSFSEGDDANPGTRAQPWKTLAKVEGHSYLAGDTILFKRGDTWKGTLTLDSLTGTSTAKIVITSYGVGEAPTIDGAFDVTGWTAHPSIDSVWQSAAITAYPDNTDMKAVIIGGEIVAEGRAPDAGSYLKTTYDGGPTDGTSKSQIIDADLSAWLTANSLTTTDLAGAEAAVYAVEYVIDKAIIDNVSGSTITLTSPITYVPYLGSGYWFQKNIKFLNRQSEWFYDKSSKVLNIYSATQPTDVKIAGEQIVFQLTSPTHVEVRNLRIIGGRDKNLYVTGATFCNFYNNEIETAGKDGAEISSSNFIFFSGNTLRDIQNAGVNASSTHMSSFEYNTLTDIGMLPGMGEEGTSESQYIGMNIKGKNNSIYRNQLTNIGYNAINFNGGGSLNRTTGVNTNGPTTIIENIINGYNMVLQDGSGIYCYENWGRKSIQGNIVLNGAPDFNPAMPVTAEEWGKVMGLYADGSTSQSNYANNLVYVADRGILLNLGEGNTLKDNIIIGTRKTGLMTSFHTDYTATSTTKTPRQYPRVRNHKVNGNLVVMGDDVQPFHFHNSYYDEAKLFGTYDGNTYVQLLRSTNESHVLAFRLYNNFSSSSVQRLYYPATIFPSFYNSSPAVSPLVSPVSHSRYRSVNPVDTITSNSDMSSVSSGLPTGWTVSTGGSTQTLGTAAGGQSQTFVISASTTTNMSGNVLKGVMNSYVTAEQEGIMRYRSFSVTKDLLYRISFDAKASHSASNLGLRLQDGDNPNTNTILEYAFDIGTSVRHYEIIIKAKNNVSTAGQMRLVAFARGGSQEFYVDNFMIEQVTATEESLDDYVKIEYNATRKDKQVSLSGSWVDEYNTPVTFPVTIKPYKFEVFFKAP